MKQLTNFGIRRDNWTKNKQDNSWMDRLIYCRDCAIQHDNARNRLVGQGKIKLEAHKCPKCKHLTTSQFPGKLCDDCYAN